MSRVTAAIRLFLMVQYKSGFVAVYFGLAIATVAAVRTLLPESWRAVVVPAVLLGEYGTMGVFMVAAQKFLSRNERSHEALWVSPLGRRQQVVAMVLASSLVAVGAGSIVFAGSFGVDERLLLLTVPLSATTVIAGSAGLIVAARSVEFTQFLLRSIPVVTVFSLPFLSYFELVPRFTFAWLPWDAALFSFANLAAPNPHPLTFALLTVQLVVFATAFLAWAAHGETRGDS